MVSMRNFAAARKSNANKSFLAGSRRCSASPANYDSVAIYTRVRRMDDERLQATPERSAATEVDRVGKGEARFGAGERLLLRLQAHHARSRGRFSHRPRSTRSSRGAWSPG